MDKLNSFLWEQSFGIQWYLFFFSFSAPRWKQVTCTMLLDQRMEKSTNPQKLSEICFSPDSQRSRASKPVLCFGSTRTSSTSPYSNLTFVLLHQKRERIWHPYDVFYHSLCKFCLPSSKFELMIWKPGKTLERVKIIDAKRRSTKRIWLKEFLMKKTNSFVNHKNKTEPSSILEKTLFDKWNGMEKGKKELHKNLKKRGIGNVKGKRS